MIDETASLTRFLNRAEKILERLDSFLPAVTPLPDWDSAIAFRWKKRRNADRGGAGFLHPIYRRSTIQLDDLHDIDAQKTQLVANTEQFLAGLPANHALLTGTRGSGKSSLIKALLNRYEKQGLRVIEVEKNDLLDLSDIVDCLENRPERFIIFCDDLSFDSGEVSFKALKVVLDGSLESPPENVLIYATSNRRHLMPEYFDENLDARRVGDEIHAGEAVEEKISLSERFGLWLSFYPFDQDAYLTIVNHWLAAFGAAAWQGKTDDAKQEIERDALNWALQRGSRSGRVAMQFAKQWAGENSVELGSKQGGLNPVKSTLTSSPSLCTKSAR